MKGAQPAETRSWKTVHNDLLCLYTMWFGKATGSSHKERLDSFYKPQAEAYDRFRQNFLWGRHPLLEALGSHVKDKKDVVWVDLGGGTGENIKMMFEYIPQENFKAIYMVDLCGALCEQARIKVKKNGWDNVHVVEGDACTFQPEEPATIVTFSYSLSMIPPFFDAVQNAISMLSDQGFLGITDFFVSSRYDMEQRQMAWYRRFFWRSIFDLDNIDIGPERRNYLENRLERVWEMNSEGSIPYVPFLRAPWYAWIGRKKLASIVPSDT